MLFITLYCSLLYIFIFEIYSKFAWKNNFLALGVCFLHLCWSAGCRFAVSRSHVQNYRRIFYLWVSKRREYSRFARVNQVISASLRYPLSVFNKTSTLKAHCEKDLFSHTVKGIHSHQVPVKETRAREHRHSIQRINQGTTG